MLNQLKERLRYREHTLTELKTETPFKQMVDKLKEQYREQYENQISRIADVVKKTKQVIESYAKE